MHKRSRDLKVSEIIALQEELDRERYWETMIEDETNSSILRGLEMGLSERKNMTKNEKNHYISLIRNRIKYLENDKRKNEKE